jgi:hypothetical protein
LVALAPYAPYAIGCWLFFMITAFHAALLRSQEELHISVVEASLRQTARKKTPAGHGRRGGRWPVA